MYQKLLFTTVSAIVLSMNQNAMALSLEDFTNSDSITWKEGQWEESDGGFYHGTIEVTDDSGETQYFTYIYTKPEGYTETSTRLNDILTFTNAQNVVFKDIESSFNGGAIYNTQNHEDVNIKADFINNSAQGSSSASGGAIYNSGSIATIGSITGDFNGNHVKSENGDARGGAIYNSVSYAFDDIKIDNITGDFIGNYAQSKSSAARGGAIYNQNSTIGGITGNFIGNYAKSDSSYAYGGAIYNDSQKSFGDITGDFINNSAQGSSFAEGGAIYINQGMVGKIIGNFIGNYVQGSSSLGGAISQGAFSKIGNITGDFIGNYVLSTSDSASGGAIFNGYNATIGDITGDFTNNSATSESSYARGGAISSLGTLTLINPKFLNNYVSGNEESKGGAIYSTKNITITAQDNGTSEFTGNYVLANGVKFENAIYMDSASTTLSLNALTGGQILFNDEINGVEGYKIALGGDDTGTITFNNNIRNADITLENTNLILGNAGVFADNSSLIANSGKLALASLGINDTLTAKSIELNNVNLNIANADVDLQSQTMGQIDHDILTNNGGEINIENFKILNDGTEIETSVAFAGGVDNYAEKALSPVYKYNVAYDNESGEFIFTRGDLDEPEPDTPVDPDAPSVPATPITRPSGYKAFNPGVFANDVFAMSAMNTQGEVAKQVFDMDTNREYCFGRIWATPYYSDDTIGYSGFYDVDSKNYGLIAGIDTRAFGDYDGWNSVYTLFGAYNDGESKYQGVKVDTKSWLVGLKASVYNGGFYGDAIVNYAWHDSDQKTAFGTDSVDSTGYGAALKAGYKHGFDKVELDTSAMLSWQTIEGDDFTSKSGAKISTDDYSRLTLTPQVKLGYSFEKVKPYALVRYNFVLDEDGRSTVNHLSNRIALPTIESKDYIEYGLGLETTDAFPHSGYAHVLRHDGGREGWSVTAGYKYNF